MIWYRICWYNRNKANHNKTACISYNIYCMFVFFILSISRMYVVQIRLIVCFMSQDKQSKTSRYSFECFQYFRYCFGFFILMYQLKLQSCFSIWIPYEIQLYCSLCTHLRFPSVTETSNANVYTICTIVWYTYIYIYGVIMQHVYTSCNIVWYSYIADSLRLCLLHPYSKCAYRFCGDVYYTPMIT